MFHQRCPTMSVRLLLLMLIPVLLFLPQYMHEQFQFHNQHRLQ
jgi:hypothetical protein